jgi:short-subunit dehydrogenase
MKKHYGNIALVTGASSGIGKSCAEYLVRLGFKVYGTSRKAPACQGDPCQGDGPVTGTVPVTCQGNGPVTGTVPVTCQGDGPVTGTVPVTCQGDSSGDSNGTAVDAVDTATESADQPGSVTMIRMDVCSDESVKAAIDYIIEREGEIGIVVNNAGMGIAGSVEDTSPEEAYLQFDTNFFGTHRVIRHVLPHMRKKGRGLIINMSSVGALFPIPFQSTYVASKAAVELMSGSLRNELRNFGIKVCVVEPGDTKTGFTGNRLFVKEGGEGSAYYQQSSRSIAVMEKDEMNGPDPIVVAKAVARAIKRKNPPAFITVGFGYKVLVFLKRLVPRSFESFVVGKMYKC